MLSSVSGKTSTRDFIPVTRFEKTNCRYDSSSPAVKRAWVKRRICLMMVVLPGSLSKAPLATNRPTYPSHPDQVRGSNVHWSTNRTQRMSTIFLYLSFLLQLSLSLPLDVRWQFHNTGKICLLELLLHLCVIFPHFPIVHRDALTHLRVDR